MEALNCFSEQASHSLGAKAPFIPLNFNVRLKPVPFNLNTHSAISHMQPRLCLERLKAGFGLFDAGEANVAAEDRQGSKKRRRV
jgi:hypothetical protein